MKSRKIPAGWAWDGHVSFAKAGTHENLLVNTGLFVYLLARTSTTAVLVCGTSILCL